ncbi:MAG TPA: hypothetical protein VNB24_09600 [Acidimicrobiales bacterium]|nr:hypothetical protein [Acidimicrobiales bacterium]
MTIEKGQPWGEPGPMPADACVVTDDRMASLALERARKAGESFPVLGLAGGDLWKTLGGKAGSLDRGGATGFPIDLGEVLVDGKLRFFVAHVVAHDRTWRHTFVAMNAQWRGEWNLGPKAHPNDGIVDTYRADLALGDRLKVWRRLGTGSHLPHPGIKPERSRSVSTEFVRPMMIEVDGERVGVARHLAVRVEPDALRVFV